MNTKRKTIKMPVRYLMNLVLVGLLFVGLSYVTGNMLSTYQNKVLLTVGINIILAVSLNVATGYLGQLPLGHAGFMAVGAYACALFTKSSNLPKGVSFAIGLVLAWVIIYKTRFGLRLRACGELPQAADSAGISVYKMRYAGTLISGFLAGIGGLIFVVPTSNVFNADVAGYGFLALAVLIFGQWKPFRIFFAALFFGFMKTVAATSSGIPFLAGLNIPPYIYKMVPYIATLIVLAFVSKNSAAPAAEGEPFDKGKR